MSKVADRTGENRRSEGKRSVSTVWRLKPYLVEAYALGENMTVKLIDQLPAKKRKKHKSMDKISQVE
jgi:hypothetical protein